MAEVSQASGNRSAAIRHFTELIVWQKAFAVGPEVFRLSRSWPAEEKSALTDQVRRSSRSIGANIAEAWGKRRDEAAFAAKPTDADAEAHATEHGLINAESHGSSTTEQLRPARALLVEVGKMPGSMIAHPESFIAKR